MTNGKTWPRCTYEDRQWDSSDLSAIPRSRRSKIAGPYSATITPAIASVRAIELPGTLIADLAEAEAEVARFDERTGTALADFAVIALRTEAATSSQIENLSASASSIGLAEHAPRSGSPLTSNAELIAANVATLLEAMKGQGPFQVSDIIDIQRILLADSAPQLTGGFRTEQVWVGGDGYSPHNATHVAPHHERLQVAMEDLVSFAARQDLGGLAHIAVAHAQFETIHPFADDNGRTGRVLIQRMLRRAGLTRQAILPLSAGLLGNTQSYFESLNQYRDGDIEPIVATFVDATFRSLENSRVLAADLADLRSSWAELITARSDSTVWPLLDYCIGRPTLTAQIVARDLGISSVAAQNAIDRLAEAGVLRQNSKAKRGRVWLVTDALEAVEQFMQRAQRHQ